MPITRYVNLSPEWAELGLHNALIGNASSPPLPALAGGSLELRFRAVADDDYGPCRRLIGRLVSKRSWFRVPVELQLAGWSTSRTELTLRPLRSGRRPGWAGWYLRVGSALMDRLVASVHEPGRHSAPPDDTPANRLFTSRRAGSIGRDSSRIGEAVPSGSDQTASRRTT